MGYVLRSFLPGSFIAEVANTAQQNAMCALRLQVQLYLHVKGDKCTEGARASVAASILLLRPLRAFKLPRARRSIRLHVLRAAPFASPATKEGSCSCTRMRHAGSVVHGVRGACLFSHSVFSH